MLLGNHPNYFAGTWYAFGLHDHGHHCLPAPHATDDIEHDVFRARDREIRAGNLSQRQSRKGAFEAAPQRRIDPQYAGDPVFMRYHHVTHTTFVFGKPEEGIERHVVG